LSRPGAGRERHRQHQPCRHNRQGDAITPGSAPERVQAGQRTGSGRHNAKHRYRPESRQKHDEAGQPRNDSSRLPGSLDVHAAIETAAQSSSPPTASPGCLAPPTSRQRTGGEQAPSACRDRQCP
jgi:hypothetical protein